MTSPGGVEVGRVSVRVVPDTSRFARQLKKELKEIAKTSKVQVAVELDIGNISEEMKRAQQKASGKKAKLDVEVDGDGVVRETRRIRQLAQKLVGAIKMTVGLNVPASAARVKAEMRIIQKVVQGYNIRIPMEIVGITKWLGILGAVSGILLMGRGTLPPALPRKGKVEMELRTPEGGLVTVGDRHVERLLKRGYKKLDDEWQVTPAAENDAEPTEDEPQGEDTGGTVQDAPALPEAPEEDKAEKPDVATVRAWAKENNIEVSAKGRISAEVYEKYAEANKN